MFPQTWLNEERVAEYQASLSANAKPTILTLSVLDEKVAEEADEQSIWDHTCLAHYIVDGHHKAYAAAKSGRPITALSFVALNQGVSVPSAAKTAAIDICARGLVSTHV